MKKIILILFLINTYSAFSEPLFIPQQIDNLWYVWAEYDGQDTEIQCKYWDGSAWTKPYQLTDNSNNDLSPAVFMDGNNNPWVVWTGSDGISTSIYSTHFNGKEWSAITQVDDVDIYSDTTPSITIDKNNTPWISWAGSDGIDDDIYISHWNGKNWASPVMINTDDSTPDIMPVIADDIVIWCGYEGGRYKLFFKQSEEKRVIQDTERFSADLPNILRKGNDIIELLWYEKNLPYKSTWNGREWSSPKATEILLPMDFLETPSFGPAHISWTQNSLTQSLRIVPMFEVKPRTLAWMFKAKPRTSAQVSDFFCQEAYAAVEENKYIGFGDSITEGVGTTDRSLAYPPVLEGKLDSRIGPSTVVNEGVGSERTIQGLDRIEDVLNSHNAKFILLMEGTNDVTYGYSTETITFNLDEMINRSKNFGTTPLLSTLPPRRDSLDDRTKEDVNPAIQRLAQDKGVTSVDQYTEIATDKDAYMFDHVHPNDAGFEIMAETWYTAINNILNPPEEDNGGGGCGVVPPIYRNNINNNLLPVFILSLSILIFKLFKWNNVIGSHHRGS